MHRLLRLVLGSRYIGAAALMRFVVRSKKYSLIDVRFGYRANCLCNPSGTLSFGLPISAYDQPVIRPGACSTYKSPTDCSLCCAFATDQSVMYRALCF